MSFKENFKENCKYMQEVTRETEKDQSECIAALLCILFGAAFLFMRSLVDRLSKPLRYLLRNEEGF